MALSPPPSAQAMAARTYWTALLCHRRLKTHRRHSWRRSTRRSQSARSSLHASTHVNREQTDLYQELIRWYDHFGLKRRDGGELPDHLAVMLEFMQFLTFQEHANAEDAKAVQTLHTAQADFASRHLVPVVQEIVSKTEVDTPRYRELPRALLAFLEDELTALL
jgi:DMSO reductase family type II enzyme chaperone